MYLNHLTTIMKQSVLHLMPALAGLSSDYDVVNNDADESPPGITAKNIDNFVLAALDSVESAVNPAALPACFKQDNAQLRKIICFLQKNMQQITQAPVDLNYFCKTGTVNVDVNTESYQSTANLTDRELHSVLGSTLMTGVPIQLYCDINYGALTYSYNNLVFFYTDYLGGNSPVINGNICCKGWQAFKIEEDVCIDNLNLMDTMFISNGDVYIYSDKSVALNDNSTINVNLTIESSIFGTLKLTATDILIETCGGKNLPVSGMVALTGENASFFTIRFNGNSNFIVAFENIGKTVNWIDIV